MSSVSSFIRNFSSKVQKNVLKLLRRTTIPDVHDGNGADGPAYAASAQNIVELTAKQYRGLAYYKINGSRAHLSRLNPNDPKEVVGVSFYSLEKTEYVARHTHQDGTFTTRDTRAGNHKWITGPRPPRDEE